MAVSAAPIPVLNTEPETIPPGAAMEPVGTADENGRVRVQKPSSDDSLAVLINGATPIPEDGAGTGYLPWFGPLSAAVDPSLIDTDTGEWDGTPPTTLGVESGSWYLQGDRMGFVVQAGPVGGLVPVQANAGASDPAGDHSYPLNPLPCLVAGGVYGTPNGLAQIWFNPSTGVAECRTSGFCGCPPTDPPDPETSCCPLWYCVTTGTGSVEVSADADGVYTPPEEWDGSEPHLSEAAALAACPVPIITLEGCDVEGEPLRVPARLTVTFLSGACAGQTIAIEYTTGSTWTGLQESTGGTFTTSLCFAAANYSGGTVGGYSGFSDSSLTPEPFELTGTLTGAGMCGSDIDVIITA